MTTVLIADDNVDFRRRVRSFVSPDAGIQVIGEAEDGESAVHEAERLRPDVVLMDVRMPRMNGLEATRRITELACKTSVIILSQFDHDEYRQAAFASGARDFVVKKSMMSQLIPAIHGRMPADP
jgi:DNA-binding NarL/FixJ family response regulator